MKYNWEKLGLIFDPSNRFEWMKTHATTPVPLGLYGNIYRIFFSTRNQENQNQTGYIDIDLNEPQNILNISKRPVFDLGQLGTFDCDGVYMTSIVENENKLYGYYGGWNAGKKNLFYSKIGLAISEDNGKSFQRFSKAPILGIDDIDPLSTMAPFVLKENQGWRMWYASASKFYYHSGKLKSLYSIKYASSEDGINWLKSDIVSIPLGNEDSNIARACVLKTSQNYMAWYPVVSKKTNQYRIGYAESSDGINFERKDDLAGINKSNEGWDSNAITYPNVIRHKEKLYMFYNGNEFGKDGFGLAICEQ